MSTTTPWKKATAVMLAASFLYVLGAASASTTSAVTGHTTYADLDALGFDNCLAAITGLVRQKVVWFNGAELFSRSASGSGLWVYATEPLPLDVETTKPLRASQDPSEGILIPTGNVTRFEDANSPLPSGERKFWEIHEFVQADVMATSVLNLKADQILRYVYAVRISEQTIVDYAIADGGSGTSAYSTELPYNFVTIVDTCKFRVPPKNPNVSHPTDEATDTPYSGPAEPSCTNSGAAPTGECTPVAHDAGTADHHHKSYNVLLFVGKEPPILRQEVGNGSDQPEVGWS